MTWKTFCETEAKWTRTEVKLSEQDESATCELRRICTSVKPPVFYVFIITIIVIISWVLGQFSSSSSSLLSSCYQMC
jgi:hypothetical protein